MDVLLQLPQQSADMSDEYCFSIDSNDHYFFSVFYDLLHLDQIFFPKIFL